MDFEQANEWEQAQRQQIAEELPAELSAAAPAVDWQPAKGSDPLATCVDRRVFLRGGAGLIGGAALAGPLQELMGRSAYASGAAIPSPYGDPVPAIDESTGLALIKLPPGFRYFSYGWTGDMLTGGVKTPSLHDGMAVISQIGNRLVLCRNHEVDAGTPFFNGAIRYSSGAAGGNTNLIFNTQTEAFEKAWPTLSGVVRPCAGGVTPWGTWLSCEETGTTTAGGTKTHGWTFEVPAFGVASPVPLTALGRMSHEATVVDPATGYVYETEDNGDSSGFYRFVPNVYGKLSLGGTLQMLKVVGVNKFDFRGALTVPTTWDVEWVTIADPDGSPTSCFNQGFNLNAGRFRRLEGCWYGNGRVYFLSTSGGNPAVGEGQVFEFNPVTQQLTVIYEAHNFAHADNPDNMTVTPRGGLILCEDNAGGHGSFPDGERLVGLTLDGGTFNFAINQCNFTGSGLGTYNRGPGQTFTGDQRQNEWAGACYSPDGQWLFANIQTPGITFAITGPWGAGPL